MEISSQHLQLHPGAGAHPARSPLKLEIFYFLAQNRDFSHEIPEAFSRLPSFGAILLSAYPLT